MLPFRSIRVDRDFRPESTSPRISLGPEALPPSRCLYQRLDRRYTSARCISQTRPVRSDSLWIRLR
jgi:hypothetical protein